MTQRAKPVANSRYISALVCVRVCVVRSRIPDANSVKLNNEKTHYVYNVCPSLAPASDVTNVSLARSPVQANAVRACARRISEGSLALLW